MKTIVIVLALFLPTLSWAGCNGDQMTTRRIEADGTETVTQQRRVDCNDRTRNVFSDCELYQWQHQWGTGTSVSCNWSERQARDVALTYAKNGDKIEWYDPKGGKGYIVVAWTRPMTEQGICRDIEMVKYYIGSMEKNNYIMCMGPDGNWRGFKGN